jgi:hypothetical protein
MAWDSRFSNYGVVKIDGSSVKVYRDSQNYTTISTFSKVTNASWAGGELNISLADGKVRRYRDSQNYSTI